MAKKVKNLPALQQTQIQSLDREEPLEKGMATYSSIFILLYLFVCFDYCGSLLLLGFFSSWSERELLFIVGSSLQWLLLLQRWALGLKDSVAVVPGLLNTGSVVVAQLHEA